MGYRKRNRENIDPSLVTDKESAYDLFVKSVRAGVARDAFQGKTRFRAVVLTAPLSISAEAALTIGQIATGGRFKFRARIVDVPSPHSIYPDPCNPEIATDPIEVLKRTKLHTEFFSSETFAMVRPPKGSIVEVELKPNVFWYDLSEGEYVGLVDASTETAKAYTPSACSPKTAFNPNVFTTKTGPGERWNPSPAPRGAGATLSDRERNAAIDTWWSLIKPYLPSRARISSRGRTVPRGRQMIYNFANSSKRNIPNSGDINDAAEVERVRRILVTSKSKGGYGLNIAPPETSNHCTGAGCRGVPGKVAFDVAGGGIWTISKGLKKFKNDPGPTGYSAVLAGGTLPGPFITSGFVRARSYNNGGGWNVEVKNGAVHIEFQWTSTST
jgi:hypothetical protein